MTTDIITQLFCESATHSNDLNLLNTQVLANLGCRVRDQGSLCFFMIQRQEGRGLLDSDKEDCKRTLQAMTMRTVSLPSPSSHLNI